jgi:hypothetical protein
MLMRSIRLVMLTITLLLAARGQVTPTLTTLYSFQEGDDGGGPTALVRGSNGVLYGATNGGKFSQGTLFKLTPPGPGETQWTHTVLYAFGTVAGDGQAPFGPLAIDASGALYGVTFAGGTAGSGMAFKLSPPAAGSGKWTETILYNFQAPGLVYPQGGLTLDSQGNLYGTATGSGVNSGGVFRLSPPTVVGAPWTETTLYTFTGGSDGGTPAGAVILDASGIVYSTTAYGGIQSANHGGLGVVFELSPPAITGGAWTESVLYSFKNANTGYQPFFGVTMDSGGSLFGATETGPLGYGDVFEVTAPAVAGQEWTETIVHNFHATDGSFPSTLVFDRKGNLYGFAGSGGSSACSGGGCGTVFKYFPPSSPGGAWRPGWSFQFSNTPNPYRPYGNLVITPGGTVFGTTSAGGTAGFGAVYQLAQ